MKPSKNSRPLTARSTWSALLTALCLAGGATTAFGNHPVLVEGEIDFDGDGLIGTAEDTDNSTDRIFGTLSAALAALNGGANQNGRITIVTSGRFAEQLFITGTNGQVTIEAAPGVEANIDAVVAGTRGAIFSGNNNQRQGVPGIIIDAASNRRVVLRNLVIRNWSEGITVLGSSHVTLDNCRLEGNRDYGIHVIDSARVAITACQINGTGFRAGTATNNVANPGNGIEFEDTSTGLVCRSTITGSYGAGLKNATTNASAVQVTGNCLFDNNPNSQFPSRKDKDKVKGKDDDDQD